MSSTVSKIAVLAERPKSIIFKEDFSDISGLHKILSGSEKQVTWFYISVVDAFLVEVANGLENLFHD